MNKPILVIGASLIDIKGKPLAGLESGTSNPAVIKRVRGGTARNVAENLARLGADVLLVSAVGDDYAGHELIDQCNEVGVNVEHVQIINKANTGTYIALLEKNGHLSVALDDVSVMEHITPEYLTEHAHLFADADMVMIDGSLTPKTIKTAVHLAHQYQIPICADPSSTRLAHKLMPHLGKLHLIVPNEVEAAALCEQDSVVYNPDDSLEMARDIVRKGVKVAVVTLSDFSLVYATHQEKGVIEASHLEMIDSTGTGDALTAAIIFGMTNGLSVVESIRLGGAAAALTLQTSETVVPDLSLDILYDHLG